MGKLGVLRNQLHVSFRELLRMDGSVVVRRRREERRMETRFTNLFFLSLCWMQREREGGGRREFSGSTCPLVCHLHLPIGRLMSF